MHNERMQSRERKTKTSEFANSGNGSAGNCNLSKDSLPNMAMRVTVLILARSVTERHLAGEQDEDDFATCAPVGLKVLLSAHNPA